MTAQKHRFRSLVSVLLCLSVLVSTLMLSAGTVYGAETDSSIIYVFTGSDAQTPGYAEGTVTFTPAESGTYRLYWADDTKALEGYYEITSMTLSANESGTFEFGYHTVIPADATQMIAVPEDAEPTAANACAVYSIPRDKRLPYASGDTLYTFNSYSDIHIDANGFYTNADKNWASALEFAVNKGTDFIVTSGDSVTNAQGPKTEWDMYARTLANSGYLNPVYESNGNHDMRAGVSSGLKAFVKASGTDNTIANYDANKPYYYVTEKNTGDLFIFMALETDSDPSSCDEFSDEQLEWVSNLLAENYGTGINIYLIQHAPIQGYGAGDDTQEPYYKALLSTTCLSTVKFKNLMDKYPNIIWMSGHTHEDYNMNYNYSNENGTACHMIHNPSIAGPTHPKPDGSHALDYTFYDGLSQGYYVAVYDDQVIYYGANVCDEKIYPAYSYIMQGSRNVSQEATNPTEEPTTSATTAATGSTLPEDTETTFYYYVNTTKWESVNCYGWSEEDKTTCIWPGYACTYLTTDENGNEVYRAEVPSFFENIIFNNGGNKKQTEDILLDGVNNCFTPDGTTASGKYNVTASVWEGGNTTEPTTDPIETTATPDESAPAPTSEPPASDTVQTTGSTAVTEPVVFKYGDVNRDGKINILDVTDIQQFLVWTHFYDEEQLRLADVNGDGIVNILDATDIQLYLAGAISEFPAEKQEETTAPSEPASSEPVSASETIAEPEPTAPSSFEPTLTEPATATAPTEIPTTPPDFAAVMTLAKDALETDYSFSSYNQYQDLKKLYYSYKTSALLPEEEAAAAEKLNTALADLREIADYINSQTPPGYDKDLVLYFAAPQAWLEAEYKIKANICFSAEDNTWGQRNMIQTTDTYNGLTVFRYTYASSDFVTENLDKLQFQAYSGSDWQAQFVAVEDTAACDSINGKLYDSASKQWVEYTPSPGTSDVTGPPPEADYALCYYSASHSWDDITTYFTKQEDGAYLLSFTSPDANDISCNVFDLVNSKYNCVAASVSLPIESGTGVTETYSLSASSSRGKSITIKGVAAGMQLQFLYDPAENTLTITYDPSSASEPTETTQPQASDYVLCYYSSDEHGWDEMDTFFTKQENGAYILNYTAVSSNSISCNVFDSANRLYNCVAASTPLDIQADTAFLETFALSASSSRGKSLTINGLKTGMRVQFVYDPAENALTVRYEPDSVSTDPSETVPTDPEPENTYVLCYYTPSHSWDERDAFFTKQQDGTYILHYTALTADNLSCNVFHMESGTYNCVPSSTSASIAEGASYTETYSLTSSSSRGKSLTIKGLTEGMQLSFVYDPQQNTLTLSYMPSDETDPTEKPVQSEYVLCYYAPNHGWNDKDTFFMKQQDGTYTLDYTVTAAGSLSCNVFHTADSTYNCVAVSTPLQITAGTPLSETFALTASSSRGKSLTLNGLEEGMEIHFVYAPEQNALTVNYTPEEKPIDPTNPILPDITEYTVYWCPPETSVTAGYAFRIHGAYAASSSFDIPLTDTGKTLEGSAVYSAVFTNQDFSGSDALNKLYFQTYEDSSFSTWVAQETAFKGTEVSPDTFSGKLYTGSGWIDFTE